MVKARELYACNKCGKWPITKIVDTELDELSKAPCCDACGGETHFEKVYEVEEQPKLLSVFEHCRQESGLTGVALKQYVNRYYGHG